MFHVNKLQCVSQAYSHVDCLLQRLCGDDQVWSHFCFCMLFEPADNNISLAQVQAHSFELEEDTTSYGDYVKGGIVTEHKDHKTLDFKPLAQALDDPGEFLLSDFAKMERPGILHLGFQALNDFQVCGSSFDVKSELSAISWSRLKACASLLHISTCEIFQQCHCRIIPLAAP